MRKRYEIKPGWRERERIQNTEHFIYTRNFFNYSELFSKKAVLKTVIDN